MRKVDMVNSLAVAAAMSKRRDGKEYCVGLVGEFGCLKERGHDGPCNAGAVPVTPSEATPAPATVEPTPLLDTMYPKGAWGRHRPNCRFGWHCEPSCPNAPTPPEAEAVRVERREQVAQIIDECVGLYLNGPPHRSLGGIDRATDRIVDLLTARAAPSVEPVAWQPWATVPEEAGKRLLAYRDDVGVFAVESAWASDDGELDNDGDVLTWFSQDGFDDLTYDLPSHWAPLPLAPITDTASDTGGRDAG